ncbi:hypothetical protein E2493_18320 [Sphingomonas parva]|uniref:YdbS-like PH domain-containing protein n=1 Tax=Sphingomonas parva TaxID=2555898 RepID=A0A4Y8ZLB8_9SPHN|nr:PH domain-containing protein [Sphingomonas parva]TFI56788.1 hypothetical protein E2493_18320 [Sphingomonas parva]
MSALVPDRRVHPGTILIRFLREAPQTLLALPAGIAFMSDKGLWGALWVAGAAALVGLSFQWLNWHRFRYGVGGAEIVIESGILHRTRREIPFERIQDVDIEQALLARVFGVAKVRIETGGGGKDEGVLDSVGVDEAARLRAAVRAWREGDASSFAPTAAADAAPSPRILFAMDLPRVLLLGLFSFSLVYLGGLFALLQTFDDPLKSFFGIDIYDPGRWIGVADEAAHSRFTAGTVAALLIVAVLIGGAVSVVRTVARDYGFLFYSEGDRFRRVRGLLTRSEVVIAKRRIQLACRETGPVRRLFGWFQLSFQTLGAASDGSGRQVAAPLGRGETLAPILAEAGGLRLPPPPALTMVSERHIVRALIRRLFLPAACIAAASIWWRPALYLCALLPLLGVSAAVARRFHRYALDGDLLFVERGVWRQSLFVVPIGRAQAVTLERTWLQRKLGLATVDIDTAGASAMRTPRIIDISHDKAKTLAAEIAARAIGARPAAAPV